MRDVLYPLYAYVSVLSSEVVFRELKNQHIEYCSVRVSFSNQNFKTKRHLTFNAYTNNVYNILSSFQNLQPAIPKRATSGYVHGGINTTCEWRTARYRSRK